MQARHLKRNAYLYVRQSTLQQVLENTESTRRQYELRQRAVALGWPSQQVVVIDTDQGQSGASAADRAGFQQLVAEVSIGRAGIVMGLEVSRLARNSADWHRLLEICALTDTLILDEDGIYDPAHFNDRLLLGLKGTMSEAELHVLRARLRGGLLAQARRGELVTPLPVGFVYDEDGRVHLHPDRRVQDCVQMLFRTFRQTGSAVGTVKAFRKQGLMFPRRPQTGPRNGPVLWGQLSHARVLHVLKNPRYAGTFFFGRTRQRKQADGHTVSHRLPQDEWVAQIRDAHEGYISWEEHEENLRRLAENAAARGLERRKSAPREGPALLQGLVVCGVCGERMTVRYHVRGDKRIADYACQKRGIANAQPFCQIIHGEALDAAIGQLLVTQVAPLSLEVAVSVQRELDQRFADADRLRYQAVEAARYEAELAQRRYMRIDPDNRLVADVLEAEWNGKLRSLSEAQQSYEQQRDAARQALTDEQQARIMALATDFPRIWKDPRTADRDRKRMVRRLIEDVTLCKTDTVTAHIRFKGGATHTLCVPLPFRAWMLRQTPAAVVAEIDRLLDEHTEERIAEILNERGLTSGMGACFSRSIVRDIHVRHGLKPRYQRLRDQGMLTRNELAAQLGVCPATLIEWHKRGFLTGHPFNDKNECLYPPPQDGGPVRWKQRKTVVSPRTNANPLSCAQGGAV